VNAQQFALASGMSGGMHPGAFNAALAQQQQQQQQLTAAQAQHLAQGLAAVGQAAVGQAAVGTPGLEPPREKRAYTKRMKVREEHAPSALWCFCN
jgi:hypothetical protein